MNIKTFSDRIGTLIGQDELKTAIDEFKELLKHSKKLDEVIVQSARFNDVMREIRRGTIDPNDANITKNQIRFALMDLLREVEESAASHPEIISEIESFQPTTSGPIINQRHSGSGDNVGGDKVINN